MSPGRSTLAVRQGCKLVPTESIESWRLCTPIHAAMKADAMLDKGDMDGQRVWLRILKAIDVLLDTCPSNSAAAH